MGNLTKGDGGRIASLFKHGNVSARTKESLLRFVRDRQDARKRARELENCLLAIVSGVDRFWISIEEGRDAFDAAHVLLKSRLAELETNHAKP
jgi:hypothetical protein